MDFANITHPTAEQVRAAREAAGLSQQQAAELVHRAIRTRWYEWEAGKHAMPPAEWELFLLKAKLKPLPKRNPHGD